jgi:hypothetical protein
MRPQVKNWLQVAAAEHCLALARHSPARDFHQN